MTMTKTKTMTKTNTFRKHPQRAILDNCDLWDIWWEWWGDMTWPNTSTMTITLSITNTIPVTCYNWHTDYNSDNWEPGLMNICVTWQLRVTLDSIRNSCNVWTKKQNPPSFSLLECMALPVPLSLALSLAKGRVPPWIPSLWTLSHGRQLKRGKVHWNEILPRWKWFWCPTRFCLFISTHILVRYTFM